jgi:hypothetical protein
MLPRTCGMGNLNKDNACEYPQYESPDNPSGRNDLRKLGDGVAWNIGRQFVILVSWDKPDPDDQVSTLRIWNLLTVRYKVPMGHVVILYDNKPPANIGPFKKLTPPFPNWGFGDPFGLPREAVTASNSVGDWDKALSGVLFMDGNKQAQTRPGDRLLIYNFGHGGLRRKALGAPKKCPPPPACTASNNGEVGYVVSTQWRVARPFAESCLTLGAPPFSPAFGESGRRSNSHPRGHPHPLSPPPAGYCANGFTTRMEPYFCPPARSSE